MCVCVCHECRPAEVRSRCGGGRARDLPNGLPHPAIRARFRPSRVTSIGLVAMSGAVRRIFCRVLLLCSTGGGNCPIRCRRTSQPICRCFSGVLVSSPFPGLREAPHGIATHTHTHTMAAWVLRPERERERERGAPLSSAEGACPCRSTTHERARQRRPPGSFPHKACRAPCGVGAQRWRRELLSPAVGSGKCPELQEDTAWTRRRGRHHPGSSGKQHGNTWRQVLRPRCEPQLQDAQALDDAGRPLLGRTSDSA